ncbi:condensation domain-containing protein, partial [Jeotgalicoccus sp. S0W5]|uniref:condensation domain-containing protein n=1 Tax=Jeotgalicoccus sp. S0W5 TaxID=2527874 RepID=UPI001F0ED613
LEEYVAPQTEVEKQLAEIWREVLEVDRVGLNDNFFEAGGDSIKAIQIASMLQKNNYSINVNEIMQHSTIKKISPHIKSTENNISQHKVTGQIPLTPIQTEFLKSNIYTNKFNQSILLYSNEKIKGSIFKQVMKILIEHHDSLRIKFKYTKSKWKQINHEDTENVFALSQHNLKSRKNVIKAIKETANVSHSSLNIETGPLMKLDIFDTINGTYILIICHHLLIDGVSWRILIEDLEDIYNSISEGNDVELPLKTNSFLDWSIRLRDYSKNEKLESEIDYWKNICSNSFPPITSSQNIKSSIYLDSKDKSFSLTDNQTTSLLFNTNHVYNTEINDILLTSLALSLQEHLESYKVGCFLEGHGREEIFEDINLNRTIGWFTSCFPVVFDFTFLNERDTKENKLPLYIKSVKETIRKIPNRGLGYGVLRYLKEDVEFDRIEKKIPIVFNYLGQFDAPNKRNNKTFKLESIRTGDSIHPKVNKKYIIEINSFVLNNQFHLITTYNSKLLNEDFVDKLNHSFRKNLINIIEHCSNALKSELTPSDLGDANLSLDELEFIQNEIRK